MASASPINDSYYSSVGSYKVLTQEEVCQLVHQLHNGNPIEQKEARDTLVVSNLRLVSLIAKRYKKYVGRGLEWEDIISEGTFGLFRAVHKYDPSKALFSTYAVYWIEQRIKQAFYEKNLIVRIPSYMQDLLSKWNKLQKEATYTGLSQKEIIKKMGIKKWQMQLLSKLLDRGINKQIHTYSPEEVPENRKTYQFDSDQFNIIRQYMKRLDKRSQQVLSMRFGLDGYEAMNLREIGSILNVTRERIRQIEKNALTKIKQEIQKASKNKINGKEIHRSPIRNKKNPSHPHAL